MIKTNLYNNSDLLINSDSINDLVKLILTNHKYISANINIIITDERGLKLSRDTRKSKNTLVNK